MFHVHFSEYQRQFTNQIDELTTSNAAFLQLTLTCTFLGTTSQCMVASYISD